MKVEEIVKKYQIQLTEPVLGLLEKGVERMKKSVDPLHDETHIGRILDDLVRLLNDNPALTTQINWPVLLLAIVWHDCWKAERQATNVIVLVWQQIYEGWGSGKIFTKEARKVGLPEEVARWVRYAIRTHTGYQFVPVKLPEARILRDLDELETWDKDRLESVKRFLQRQEDAKKRRGLRILYFYYFILKRKMGGRRFYFTWSRREFFSRKEQCRQDLREFSTMVKRDMKARLTSDPVKT